jgi:hypothetical protein
MNSLAPANRDKQKTLQAMIEKISAAELNYGGGNKYAPIDVGSSMHTKYETKWLFFTKETTVINLAADIMAIEENPESIEMTLLHELSHAVDFSDFAPNTNSPFAEAHKCLKDKKSVGARDSDPACYEELARKYENSNPVFSVEAKKIAGYMRKYPYSAWRTPTFPKDELRRCQQSQHCESFCDWLSAQRPLRTL